VISADNMQLLEERPACKEFVCQPDHVVNSPDGKEFWISNNMGYITVFDQKTLAMTAEIRMPLRADPHGGVFVQYDRSGKGHVVMDLGGPHGGVSPYPFDNANGIPTLATALAGGWAAAKTSSALAAGSVKESGTSTDKATIEVTMDDFFFAPKDLTIPAGREVTFKIVNRGQVAHNFLSKDLGIEPFDVKAGGSGEFTWKGTSKTGTFKYVCSYHPGMGGTITVK
jgi:plastocyanin